MSPSERSRRAGIATAATRPDRWSDGDKARVFELRSAGVSTREIAAAVQRPLGSVESFIHTQIVTGALTRVDAVTRKRNERNARAAITAMKHARAQSRVRACERADAFGYVVGCLYGDAFVSRKSIVLKARDASFVASFAQALTESLGARVRRCSRVEPVKRIGNVEYRDVTYHEVYLHNRHLVGAVVDLVGDTTKLGWQLDVDAALARGADFCNGLIRGLFDSDGSFHRAGARSVSIRYGSTNESGIRAFHSLMERLGYDVGLGKPTKKGERRIQVRMSSAERYAREVSSSIDYKKAVLDGFLEARSR